MENDHILHTCNTSTVHAIRTTWDQYIIILPHSILINYLFLFNTYLAQYITRCERQHLVCSTNELLA